MNKESDVQDNYGYVGVRNYILRIFLRKDPMIVLVEMRLFHVFRGLTTLLGTSTKIKIKTTICITDDLDHIGGTSNDEELNTYNLTATIQFRGP